MQPFDAIQSPINGTCLIEAGAGTGKTHTITTLVLRLILEEALLPEQILVVTFTTAATAELARSSAPSSSGRPPHPSGAIIG